MGDKMRLLFFGIIPENVLPIKEVVKEQVVIQEHPNVPVPPPPADINTKDGELKLHIPFFDSDNEVKSNF